MTVDQTVRTLGLIGLAKRAGKVVDGQDRVTVAITSRKARLVLIADDSGENGRKKLTDKCKSYQVPCVVWGQKAELGHAIGRSSVAAFAIVDSSFADKLLQKFGEFHGGEAFDESPSV